VIDPALASEAVATMNGDRMRTHGNPADTLARIAQMWTGYLGKDIHPTDVAQMMVMVKQARSRSAYDRDHYLDAIAYTLLAEASARP
jgi:hypothetical protein